MMGEDIMKWSGEKLIKWGWVLLILFIFGIILAIYNFYPLVYMFIMGTINLLILIWVI